MKLVRRFALSAPLLMMAFAQSTSAQSSEQFGDYIVHFNALSTESIGRAMAKKYAITRSSRHGMMNISVQKASEADGSTALRAKISGTSVNLMGQNSDVVFREIPDTYVSYIGLFPVKGPDTYTFNLTILPEGATRPINLRFNQNFAGE
jgi:hypothetical protein